MLKMARKLLQAEYEFVYLTMPTKMLGKVRLKKNTFLLFHFFKYRSNEPIQWRALINFSFIRAWQNLRKKLNELGPRTLMTKLQFFISIGRPGGHHLTAMLYRDDSIIF